MRLAASFAIRRITPTDARAASISAQGERRVLPTASLARRAVARTTSADFATAWLPRLLRPRPRVHGRGCSGRLIGSMPRTKPQNMATKGSSTTTWDDVAGVEEVRAELKEVVDFLRDPKRFERLGAQVPKGLLLYGPPGTGKTLLAKAVAHESGANFYAASASAFVEMFAGLGAARIRKLFEEARKNAPAIVFIDELDAVGAQRTGHGFNREQDQTLNQLLVELDGFDGATQVVVMGASNRHPGSRPGAAAPGPLRPADARPAARSRRPRGDPRASTRAASRSRADVDLDARRAPDLRPHRRRAREHLQRGGDRRRPRAATASIIAGRLRRTRSSASSPACSSGRC